MKKNIPLLATKESKQYGQDLQQAVEKGESNADISQYYKSLLHSLLALDQTHEGFDMVIQDNSTRIVSHTDRPPARELFLRNFTGLIQE